MMQKGEKDTEKEQKVGTDRFETATEIIAISIFGLASFRSSILHQRGKSK
jgi:hypothetical protein